MINRGISHARCIERFRLSPLDERRICRQFTIKVDRSVVDHKPARVSDRGTGTVVLDLYEPCEKQWVAFVS
jgi:hypothetical protein